MRRCKRNGTNWATEAFEYSVLEGKEIEEQTDVSWELKQMLKKWMQTLQPYGEKGYHKKKD